MWQFGWKDKGTLDIIIKSDCDVRMRLIHEEEESNTCARFFDQVVQSKLLGYVWAYNGFAHKIVYIRVARCR